MLSYRPASFAKITEHPMCGSAVKSHDWTKKGRVLCPRQTVSYLLSFQGNLSILEAVRLLYRSVESKFERFRIFWNLLADSNSNLFSRIFFFERFDFFGVFKVQSHTMWPYMCLCCGLFVPTQFHFECCGVRDDMWMYMYMSMIVSKFRDFESGLSQDLKDGEWDLRRANAGGGSWRYWRSDRSLCL